MFEQNENVVAEGCCGLASLMIVGLLLGIVFVLVVL